MFRKVLLTTSPVYFGAVAVSADNKKPASPPPAAKKDDELAHFKCKPKDLPLYLPLHSYNKTKELPPHPEDSATRKAIQSGVKVVRVEVSNVCNSLSEQKKSLDDAIDKGKAHTKFVFDYLNEPDNTVPRAGAIAIGGFAGFIFAVRGGFIRRVLYTGIGAGAIASICYPKEAEVYAQRSLVEAKKLATIGYNFAYGVKPGDDVNAPNWPKIPTNMSELSDSFSDIAKSAKDAVFSSKK